MFSTTGIISNGRRSSIGPAKLNRIPFIHDNLAFVISDNWQGRLHWLCLSETLFVGSGGSTDGFFARKPSLKRLASAVRRTSYWTFVVQPTRVVWAKERKNVSCERTVCRHDPTSEYVCFLRGSLHCELVRWSAKIQKQACWEHVQQLISSCIGLLVRS